ncbi:MAG TPA: biotin/lipoyl-containing protein, partial [Vicinamibacterales bacterium]|nr:biotin/lipoyl-containing protein [Vicinamibacterales bacterium]
SVRRTADAPSTSAAAPTVPVASGGVEEPSTMRDYTLLRVESPMVGTFYAGAAPTDPPFVQEGDAVVPGQTLCILEAMKLMNEVKSEVVGLVHKIHVGNADSVEYGQLLFELEPIDGRPFDAI